jgi:hypothetical protein
MTDYEKWRKFEQLRQERADIALDALKPKSYPGARPRLTAAQLADVTRATRGRVVTLAKIGGYIRSKYGVTYSRGRLCQLSQAYGGQGEDDISTRPAIISIIRVLIGHFRQLAASAKLRNMRSY